MQVILGRFPHLEEVSVLSNHKEGALEWWDSGMCVIPARADGSKRPVHEWKSFMGQRPSRELVESWYSEHPEWGVGIVCGDVSGGLEMLEIEACRMGSEFLDLVRDAMTEQGEDVVNQWDWFFEQGYAEFTPSGGIHILYRIADQPVPGNQKIAMSEDSKTTYAETRGQGGFTIVAPTSGTVHPSGESWAVCGESIVGQTVRSVSWEMRSRIHAALKTALDERVLPVYERPAGSAEYDRSQGDRPGDAFNDDDSVTIHDILVRNGWKYLGRKQGQDEYCHPNSSDMSTGSARTGHQGSPNLYAWSGMPQEGSYDKFAVLAHLEYGGDFSATSAALRRLGYGAERQLSGDMDDWNTEDSADVDSWSSDPASPQAPEPIPTLKEFSHTGVAKFASSYILSSFRVSAEEGFWRTYENGRWVRDMERKVSRAAQKVSEHVKSIADRFLEQAKAGGDKDEIAAAKAVVSFGASCRSTRGTKDLVEAFACEKGVTVTLDKFDRDPNLIVLSNGTFDLSDMKLREHRPQDMITKCISVSYDPDAIAPRWVQFLEEVIPDKEQREFIQRAAGMTLLGRTEEGAFFILHGPTGCGKSQFLDVMRGVFGEYAVTTPASTFAARPSGQEKTTADVNSLRGARFACLSETAEGARMDESLIKAVTGGDTINSRGLYQNFTAGWKPQFTLWMATNHLPSLSAGDNAIWRRVKPIEFPHSFTSGERSADRELGLGQKILAAEASGVLNWLIEGARKYLEDGFGEPDSVKEATRNYQSESDHVLTFLLEAVEEGRIERGDDFAIKSGDFYRVYKAWCDDNAVHKLGDRKFGQRLAMHGIESYKGHGGVRMRRGVRINPEFGIVSAQTTW